VVALYNWSGSSNRNDYSGFVGMAFLTPASGTLKINALGRYFFTGNTGAWTVYVLDLSGSTLASASVSPGSGFTYTSITELTLSTNTYYLLVGNVVNGGTAAWCNSPQVAIGTANTNSINATKVMSTHMSYFTGTTLSGPYTFDRYDACFIPVNARVSYS
jgi:hypothetical protein